MGKLYRNTKISLAILFLLPIILSSAGLSILGVIKYEERFIVLLAMFMISFDSEDNPLQEP